MTTFIHSHNFIRMIARSILNFPVLPFIYALSALILQNPSFVTDFFRNFAIKDGELTPSRHKKD